MNNKIIKMALGGFAFMLSPVYADTITVTTKQDISSAKECSLRDAVRAISKPGHPFGGCPIVMPGNHKIQLEADLDSEAATTTYYELASPLEINGSVTIQGADTLVEGVEDTLTNSINSSSLPKTTIKIQSGIDSRIAVVKGEGVTFKDLNLEGGKAVIADNNGNGSAIWATGNVSLNNVIIRNAHAAGAGTIFLAGVANSLTATLTTFENNYATEGGAVVAMSCYSKGIASSRGITLQQSSFINNSISSASTNANYVHGIIALCGDPTFSATNVTFTENTGDIVVYKDIGVALGSMPATAAQVNIHHLTALKNNGKFIVLPADKSPIAYLSMQNSVIGANQSSVKDCDAQGADYLDDGYVLGNITSETCDLTILDPNDSFAVQQQFPEFNANASIVNNFFPLGYYGGKTKGFLPTLTSITVGKGESCASTDQRGVLRDNTENQKCSVGAMELRLLKAVAESGTNSDDPDAVDNAKREVYLDVLANDIGSESGDPTGEGTRFKPKTIEIVDDANQRCVVEERQDPAYPDDVTKKKEFLVFKPELVDGIGELTEEPVVCKYKMTDSDTASTVWSNEVEVQFTVNNLKPIAKDKIYTRAFNGDTFYFSPITDATDPDGIERKLPNAEVPRPLTDAGPLTKAQCANGAFIQITTPPQLGTVTGVKGVMANVVTGMDLVKYYGSELAYKPNNSQSPFTDSFKYTVLDADCEPSNEATVYIKVEGQGVDERGGGAFGVGLIALFGMLFGLRLARKL